MPCGRCTGGGHHYPWLVRNTPRKPIKVFMQDGDGDLNKAAGNWPLANRQMHAALEYAGCKRLPPLSTCVPGRVSAVFIPPRFAC